MEIMIAVVSAFSTTGFFSSMMLFAFTMLAGGAMGAKLLISQDDGLTVREVLKLETEQQAIWEETVLEGLEEGEDIIWKEMILEAIEERVESKGEVYWANRIDQILISENASNLNFWGRGVKAA